ncbi:hypothetical protein [Actinokineospora sp. HUAS TT18]|uniref:hypothetical protein n=1 Tax=Actinokineospora sp. HUAS TT18 TaxID=3447451 RepID=UPI003F522FDC
MIPGRGGLAAVLGWAILVLAGCSTAVSGAPVAAPVAPPNATESITQSLVNLGESSTVRYQGTLSSASDDDVTFDVTAAQTGEIAGSFTLDGKAATVLVVNKTTYLKAGADFWATLSGVANSQGKGAAVADRWVKVPTSLIGVEFGDVFTPDVLGQNLAKGADKAGTKPIAEGERAKVGEVPTVKVTTGGGSVYVTEAAPHGVVKVEMDKVGRSDTTSVKKLVATVADGSAEIAKFYQDVSAQAAELTAPIDVLTTVTEGTHNFDGCGAASCSIIVQFTNPGKVAVRVSVRGTWQGDNAPLGVCDATAGPVGPGAAGSAKCTLATPQWVSFFQRANSVPGNHPYSVEWSTVVLADAPDLAQLTARAAAKPADASAAKSDGSHFVYSIGYSDAEHQRRIWKYGVVAGKFWRDHADQQVMTCLRSTGSGCAVTLVTATGDAASAQGLVHQLVEAYKAEHKECPKGQWVGCKR